MKFEISRPKNHCIMKKCLAIFLLLGLFACTGNQQNSVSGSDTATIYFNGEIITMEGDSAVYAEALVEKAGKILFVGDKASALREAGKIGRAHV